MFAGLLRCAKCGASYVLETSGKADSKGECTYRYYNCRAFVKSGKEACAGHRFPVEKLERAVLEHLADKVFTVDRCRALIHDIAEESGVLRQKTDEHRRELKQQLVDDERRIATWQEAFETHAESADVILPRLRELRTKRDEVATTLNKVIPIRLPPPQLYTEATILRFQKTVRDLFLSAVSSLAKTYLNFLVARIDVHGNELEIHGKTIPTVALMAEGSDLAMPPNVKTPTEVLTSVGGWLPTGSRRRTTVKKAKQKLEHIMGDRRVALRVTEEATVRS